MQMKATWYQPLAGIFFFRVSISTPANGQKTSEKYVRPRKRAGHVFDKTGEIRADIPPDIAERIDQSHRAGSCCPRQKGGRIGPPDAKSAVYSDGSKSDEDEIYKRIMNKSADP